MAITGFRALMASLAVLASLTFIVVESDAAPRFNAGSRGTRTYTAPPPTATSPNATRPIERSITQPGVTTPRPTTPVTQPGGFFGRGLLGGLAAGFLGAGLIGLLMGHGFLGGLAGFASFLGLLIQVGLVVLVAVLAWRWWQRRSQPAQPAFASGPALRDFSSQGPRRASFGGIGGFTPATDDGPIEIKPADYAAFERVLGDVYAAYSAEDTAAMRAVMTPEMVSYYAEELAKNSSRGVVNQVTDVKLLQGDLSEAWREGNDEYASVAMRYSINDRVTDRASGRLIEGGPQEGVEIWTFRRVRGGNWMLSAIQQTD